MAKPGQSPEEAAQATQEHVDGDLAAAQALLNPDGSFSKLSLEHMGNAIHTLQDTTSPMHTDSSGIELPTPIGFTQSFSHFLGEDSPSKSWMGFGQGIRFSLAVPLYVSPEYMAQRKQGSITYRNVDHVADDRISNMVQAYSNVHRWTPLREEQTRECALGNPAACD
jgi:hypothetical protein